jgi:hypothetical protein
MRVSTRLAVPGLALLALIACGPGYTTTRVGVGVGVSSGVDLYGYDAATYGDWHTSYRQWTPTVVYESNGTYYPSKVRGARQVQVYRTERGYMLPPRDAELTRTDRRVNAKKLPNDQDYGRARPRP